MLINCEPKITLLYQDSELKSMDNRNSKYVIKFTST